MCSGLFWCIHILVFMTTWKEIAFSGLILVEELPPQLKQSIFTLQTENTLKLHEHWWNVLTKGNRFGIFDCNFRYIMSWCVQSALSAIEKRHIKQVPNFHNKAAGYWWEDFKKKNLYMYIANSISTGIITSQIHPKGASINSYGFKNLNNVRIYSDPPTNPKIRTSTIKKSVGLETFGTNGFLNPNNLFALTHPPTQIRTLFGFLNP